ncbi:MAG: hypothetical protein ACJAR3_002115 [Roseivirga sp.]|jgi:putative transposase
MGQSRVQNYIHLVFGTKYRQQFIRTPHEKELHANLGRIGKELECPAKKSWRL